MYIILILFVYLFFFRLVKGFPSDENLPKCIESKEDISKQISGTWITSEVEFPEMFSSSTDKDEWLKNACPSQSRVFSCDYRDAERGKIIRNRIFKPSGCKLAHFNPILFLEKFRNHQLITCCDSMSQQFYSTLLCSLAQFAKHKSDIEFSDVYIWDYNKKKLNEICPFPHGLHCHILTGTAFFPEYNFTMVLTGDSPFSKEHGEGTIQDFISLYRLNANDVILMNFGLHFSLKNHHYKRYIQRLASEYKFLNNKNSAVLPHFIWRETSAQNFLNEEDHEDYSGYFRSFNATNICGPSKDLSRAFEQDSRNRLADDVFGKVGVPIMRVANATMTEWHQHILHRFPKNRKKHEDCTHYCQPSGVFYHWREVFFNIINILI